MHTATKFPDLTYAAALSETPVLLDGQKVVFDKKVILMPVELEKKPDTHGVAPSH
jgi:hypothetical protein